MKNLDQAAWRPLVKSFLPAAIKTFTYPYIAFVFWIGVEDGRWAALATLILLVDWVLTLGMKGVLGGLLLLIGWSAIGGDDDA